jgi:type VI secretion system protein ImpL
MKFLLRLVFNRWVLGVIAIVAFAMVIWWGFPTIAVNNVHPFESETIRWIQIAILVLAPIARIGWRYAKARSANAALIDGLIQKVLPRQMSGQLLPQHPMRPQEKLDSSASASRKRWRFSGSAVPAVRNHRCGRGSDPSARSSICMTSLVRLHRRPGSGKTTALTNSGLRFPLAARFGREAVRGVGGTRDCDWWFTDEAVFLDTAGRYTTQQSHKEVDAGAWKGFLQLLKKSRPRRPINGVLVTLSVGDLLQQSPAEWEAHIEAVRARVRELYELLVGASPSTCW